MFGPFRFAGTITRFRYALWSIFIYFIPHIVVALIALAFHYRLAFDALFWLDPARELVWIPDLPSSLEFAAFGLILVAAWLLAALAFRRARDANLNGWIAAPVIVPALQIPFILLLCILPSRTTSPDALIPSDKPQIDSASAIQGMAAGMLLTIFAVATGALVFGSYGYGMFVAAPFVIGALAGYLANRKTDIGPTNTAKVVYYSGMLGAVALVAVALEGLLCIVVAAPLAGLASMVGGLFGRAAARTTRRSTSQSLMSIALLPIVFGSEQMFPPSANFTTRETIDIDAKPAAVWRAIVDMAPLTEAPSLPFRLGVAYPISARIEGQGAGATRIGVFSTGIAVERVTQWEPNRLLAFAVLSNPPAMHELSPYRTVHAPHIDGYFLTTLTSFQLVPLPNGRTRLVERTEHELKLGPVIYWLPLARWVIHENNMRVLAHITAQATAEMH